MGQNWYKNLFKLVNRATIVGYPNTMPKEIHKWFPKFTGNDVVTLEVILIIFGMKLA
jgi:hypothetical protein